MSRVRLALLALAGVQAIASAAHAQQRPYIGFVYPAGGQQGSTFYVKLGGQGLEGVERAVVSGTGVSVKLVEYFRKLGPQEITLLNEQLRELRRGPRGPELAKLMAPSAGVSSGDAMLMSGAGGGSSGGMVARSTGDPTLDLMLRIQKRLKEYRNRPACASIASLAVFAVKIAPNAKPGERELCVIGSRGVSNPLVFHVGQIPEIARKPMITSEFQVLGKEYLAQRKRPDDEVEQRLTIPCVANGQVATGEINYYRFEARKGQRLVISAQARQLMPYVADAVPGWFQPVMALYNSRGKQVAYDDDYRFKPDPVILYRVPEDGEYVFTITDAVYRGREDFVYRVTIGELPFITSVFPLGGRVGARPTIALKGWNVESAELNSPPPDAGAGIYKISACNNGFISNPVPFALDNLPEAFDKEPNNTLAKAQKVKIPVIINGRMDRADDSDVFQIAGQAGETIVAEVQARRLDSPLDSMLKITDATGKALAFSDDCEDLGAGTNTHDADSYILFKLPADGTYYVHLTDTARDGGPEYAYRLRISQPRPDFALRVVPTSVALRSKGNSAVSVHVIRKDGFDAPIKLGLKDPPEGFSAKSVNLAPDQAVTRLTVKTVLTATNTPVVLRIEGVAKVDKREIARPAVPAEDRMQAFLWRHLVPAQEFKVLVYDPSYQAPPKRVSRFAMPTEADLKAKAAAPTDPSAPKPKFSKQQVAGRVRQIKILFQDGLLSDEFQHAKILECEATQ